MKVAEDKEGAAPPLVDTKQDPKALLDALWKQRDEVRQAHRLKLRQHHESFHPIWGRLLKTGYQNSRLAHQIERFACLYTSHVSNLLYYSPTKSYRYSQVDFLISQCHV